MASSFFQPVALRVSDIAQLVGAQLARPDLGDRVVERVASVDQRDDRALVFIEARTRKTGFFESLKAAAVLATAKDAGLIPPGIGVLVVARPQLAFAMVAAKMYPTAVNATALAGRSDSPVPVHLDASANVETGAIIEPGAVVGPGVTIGRGTVVGPNAVIGSNTSIGRDCLIGAGTTIQCAIIGDRCTIHPGVRIGQDGFGFVPSSAGLTKMPQIGRVIIQDNVEIGANTTIDRGALDDTVIGEGTKIDNLVQIGHNVRIGRHCAIAGQVGISGSVTIGDGVMLGGRAGLADHVTIGDRAQIAAASGVMTDIPAGERWAGAPAMPARAMFRQIAALKRLSQSGKGDPA